MARGASLSMTSPVAISARRIEGDCHCCRRELQQLDRLHDTMQPTECLGDSALFWSHIVDVYSIATFGDERVGDIDTLAGWRRISQQFQLAHHLLIICAICHTWSHWIWLFTSACTSVIMGLLQCVSSKASVSEAADDDPRTECCWVITRKLPAEPPLTVSDDSTRPGKEITIKTAKESTFFEGRALPKDIPQNLPLEIDVPVDSATSTIVNGSPSKLGQSEVDDHCDAGDSSSISLIPATSDVCRNERGLSERPEEHTNRRHTSSRQSRLALLRERAKPSSARGANSTAAENGKLQSVTSSSSDAPYRGQEDGTGIKQSRLITIPSSAGVKKPSVVAARPPTGKRPVRTSPSIADLTAATFGLDLRSLEIMVVEDDAMQQVVVEKYLQRQGIQAVCVDCGEDAISLLEERERKGGQDSFQGMILMDLMMPGLNGHETTEKIRKLYPTAALPIIMLTSDESEATVVEAVRRGANDILTKNHLKGCLIARIAAQLSTLRFWRSKLDAQKNEQLLQEILPVSVIERLNEGPRLIYDEHPEVSIVFTDIVGFTDLASSVPTRDLIEMLDKLFNTFDTLCDKHGVYKVETIGDAYMVVAGHEASSQGDHAIRAVQMAADMVAAASCLTMPNGKPLKIRAGVHSGPAFSGVVGWKRPRFCMFGDTVNVASRMESTSFSSCVQLSTATRELYRAQQQQQVPDAAAKENMEFQSLSPRDIKGKGIMTTFLAKVGDWEEAVKHLDTATEEQGLLLTTSGSAEGLKGLLLNLMSIYSQRSNEIQRVDTPEITEI